MPRVRNLLKVPRCAKHLWAQHPHQREVLVVTEGFGLERINKTTDWEAEYRGSCARASGDRCLHVPTYTLALPPLLGKLLENNGKYLV